MKVVNVNLGLKFPNIDNSGNMLDQDGAKETILKDVLKIALASELKTDSEGSQVDVVERRLKNYDLLADIRDSVDDAITITPEQADYLKNRVAVIFPTLIAAPAIKHLNIQVELQKPKLESVASASITK